MFDMTKDDFKNVHNGLCEFRFAISDLEEVLNKELLKKLKTSLKLIETGFAGVREQERDQFDRLSSYYEKTKKENKFISVWSMYSVIDFSERVDFPVGINKLAYKDYNDCEIELPANFTWLDLWKAADSLIRKSEDRHHNFVEAFVQSKDDPSVLFLYTGS